MYINLKNHSTSCTEGFYKENVNKMLKSTVVSEIDKKKMIKILQKMKEEREEEEEEGVEYDQDEDLLENLNLEGITFCSSKK